MMATSVEHREAKAATPRPLETTRSGSPAIFLAPLALALAAWGATLFASGAMHAEEWTPVLLAITWTIAGTVITVRRPRERTGLLVLFAATLGSLAMLATAAVEESSGSARDLAELARPLATALLPAAALHVLLALPDGRLMSRGQHLQVMLGYVVALAVGIALWTDHPSLPTWPIWLESITAAAIGMIGSNARYQNATGIERQRLQWVGLGITVAAEVAIVVVALQVLLDWPSDVLTIAALGTLPIPVALALGASRRIAGTIGSLLAHAISLAGLTGIVCAVYFVIVLGLGRAPDDDERTLLLLSMIAAAVAALLYLPARERVSRFANSLVYGEQRAPEEALRTFGSRLSRAVPLDELLLQLAESLRKSLGLATAEVWTGTDGNLERTVSDPDRGRAKLTLGASEVPVVTRAGVSGNAWAEIWLPDLLAGRERTPLRVAPITHSGELLGLIVTERAVDDEPFEEEDDRVLAELARQVGLALHNVELDSALQASLDELRRQADELRASRTRIVAATDAERRRIERDLHDGAQQHLVALAVKLRLAQQLSESDPEQAKKMLGELGSDLQDAVQELRDFAHGIYPPLLMDRGLAEALAAAGARSPLPVHVEADGIDRYPQEVEAAIYFCCLEGLQNAGKHAGEGAQVTVRLGEQEGGLVFEVADTGKGFDVSRRGGGVGFTNMKDRLGAIGGTLRLESTPGAGTRLTGVVPLPD
jgi:signal transduction histidine kinase